MKSLIISLSIILFGYNFTFSNTKDFYFNVKKEGVYKTKIPSNLIGNNLYLYYQNKSSQVYINKNYVYFYCPSRGNYQISRIETKKIKPIVVSSWEIIKKKKYYKYALSNSLNEKHWFTDIISDGKSFKTNFTVIKKTNGYSKEIQLNLYNFKSSNAPIILKINNMEKHYVLEGHGDQFLNIPINNIKSEKIALELISLFNDVGVESIKINSFADIEIVLKYKFEKNTFSSPKTLKEINEHYFYFTLKKNKLERVFKNKRVSNLIIQKKTEIEEVKLINVIHPSYKKVDFLILYNKEFENNLKALKELLNIINPNLSYNYINVQDVYNKYSYSTADPKALKKYLHYIKPKHVLLVGDSNIKENKEDLIPTFFYTQFKGNTRIETDYIYTYKNDPASPLFSISRLPFKTTLELDCYIKKTTSFLNLNNKNNYVIYDDISVLNDIEKKKKVSYTSFKRQNALKKLLGFNFIPNYLNDNIKNMKTFQFTGHASFSGWSDNKKVEFSDMKNLNKNNLFILIDLSCWTGTFAYHKRNSFSENLLALRDKGSVTSLSVSGYSQISNYKHITNYLLKNRNKSLGSVITKMKKELFKKNELTLDDIHAYNLFGISTLKY
ncbi:C25 family cysteine peptidase [Polaribacter sp. Z022]|uniref:C25 family cysteine peptidase n=1 Tax=Polaribacter sp. Z022 TaxID=2927125 RepID=UPI0020210591|nr:C25 family cysteine peptidase [Polaribacter sp. Z022]MCL7753104.1 C25 family cysteine peptidase [Polaribacter sp. Z022]